jgi:hypothetical protein
MRRCIAVGLLIVMGSTSGPIRAADKPAAEKAAASKPAASRKPTYVAPGDDDVKAAVRAVAPAKSEAKKPVPTAKAKVEKPLTPGGKFRAGDIERPRPVVVAPPTESSQQRAGAPPSDAIILFDGSDLSQWVREGRRTDPNNDDELKPTWDVKNGYLQCVPRSGGIGTRESFGDCQLHIEWATPAVVSGSSQGRGNSGIMLHGIGEVQVLDSYGNDTYPDGQAAAIYNRYPPRVNASRRPGEWQTYDIILELAKVDEKTKQLIRPARITVLHNGVVVHHAAELDSRAASFRFGLQDHGNTVRYRNIWLRPLKEYDAQ